MPLLAFVLTSAASLQATSAIAAASLNAPPTTIEKHVIIEHKGVAPAGLMRLLGDLSGGIDINVDVQSGDTHETRTSTTWSSMDDASGEIKIVIIGPDGQRQVIERAFDGLDGLIDHIDFNALMQHAPHEHDGHNHSAPDDANGDNRVRNAWRAMEARVRRNFDGRPEHTSSRRSRRGLGEGHGPQPSDFNHPFGEEFYLGPFGSYGPGEHPFDFPHGGIDDMGMHPMHMQRMTKHDERGADPERFFRASESFIEQLQHAEAVADQLGNNEAVALLAIWYASEHMNHDASFGLMASIMNDDTLMPTVRRAAAFTGVQLAMKSGNEQGAGRILGAIIRGAGMTDEMRHRREHATDTDRVTDRPRHGQHDRAPRQPSRDRS